MKGLVGTAASEYRLIIRAAEDDINSSKVGDVVDWFYGE